MMKNNMINFIEQENIMKVLKEEIDKISKKYLNNAIDEIVLNNLNTDLEVLFNRMLIINKLPRIIDSNMIVWELNKLDAIMKDKNSVSIEPQWKAIGKIK